jgi:hypothetical protein
MVMRRAKKRKNLSSAPHYDQIGFRFHTTRDPHGDCAQRLHRRLSGKLATVIDQIEHGHHVFRVYFKHAFLKQYEKFSTFLRNETVLQQSQRLRSQERFGPSPSGPRKVSRPSPATSPPSRRSPNSRLETAYHHADKAIQTVVDLLAAALRGALLHRFC